MLDPKIFPDPLLSCPSRVLPERSSCAAISDSNLRAGDSTECYAGLVAWRTDYNLTMCWFSPPYSKRARQA